MSSAAISCAFTLDSKTAGRKRTQEVVLPMTVYYQSPLLPNGERAQNLCWAAAAASAFGYWYPAKLEKVEDPVLHIARGYYKAAADGPFDHPAQLHAVTETLGVTCNFGKLCC